MVSSHWGREQVIAGQAIGLGALDDQLALEVVLEDQLGVAGDRRILGVELEEIVALDELLDHFR